MNRARILRQARGRWAWLAAAATAAAAAATAGLLAVRRGVRRREGADGTPEAAETVPEVAETVPEAAETVPPAAGIPVAAPDNDEAPPEVGNGSAAPVPAADGLPA